ncbi:hypothetical protein GCM10023187_17190 [Nibrella viscosa]|uniref:Uncharacterized protein n=1 Tax=Nibrella viscosa TaxID=1084524 RepID=A0ABP8K886_9BACT
MDAITLINDLEDNLTLCLDMVKGAIHLIGDPPLSHEDFAKEIFETYLEKLPGKEDVPGFLERFLKAIEGLQDAPKVKREMSNNLLQFTRDGQEIAFKKGECSVKCVK